MGQNKRRQVAPRIQIIPLQHVAFRPDKPLLSKPVAVANISPFGIGFSAQSFAVSGAHKPNVTDVLQGKLIIGELSNPRAVSSVRIEVRHTSEKVIGGMFVEASAELKKAIDEYFSLETSALATRKVDSRHHKQEVDGRAHWIHGDNSELYFVENAGKVIRFRIVFFGTQLSWQLGDVLSIGQVIDDEVTGRIAMKGSERIQDVTGIDNLARIQTLSAAERFLRHLGDLEKTFLDQILTSFK